jgi:hypothetical protein
VLARFAALSTGQPGRRLALKRRDG